MSLKKCFLGLNSLNNLEELRKNFQENSLVLRKNKASRNLVNRNQNSFGGILRSEWTYDLSLIPLELCPIFPHLFSTTSKFSDYLNALNSCSDHSELLLFLHGLNSLISHPNFPMNELIVFKTHLKLLSIFSFPDLLKDTLSIFVNMTSAYPCKVFVDDGLVEKLLEVLEQSSEDLASLALWVLGNIVGDSFECKNWCLNKNVVVKVFCFLNKTNCLENALFVLKNFSIGKPSISESILDEIGDQVLAVLELDPSLVLETLSKCTENRSLLKISVSSIYSVMSYLKCNKKSGYFALRVIGNLIISNNEHIPLFLNSDFFDKILPFLQLGDPASQKEALMVTSNIITDLKDIEELLRHDLFKNSLQFLIGKNESLTVEAVWVVKNCAKYEAAKEEIKLLGYFEVMVSLLATTNSYIVIPLLESLDFFLEDEELFKEFCRLNGKEILVNFKNYSTIGIKGISIHLLGKFF